MWPNLSYRNYYRSSELKVPQRCSVFTSHFAVVTLNLNMFFMNRIILSKTTTNLICKTISGPYGKASKHTVMIDQGHITLPFRGKYTDWYILKDIFNNGKNKRIVCCIKAKWFLLGPVNNGTVMVFQREHCHFNSALE